MPGGSDVTLSIDASLASALKETPFDNLEESAFPSIDGGRAPAIDGGLGGDASAGSGSVGIRSEGGAGSGWTLPGAEPAAALDVTDDVLLDDPTLGPSRLSVVLWSLTSVGSRTASAAAASSSTAACWGSLPEDQWRCKRLAACGPPCGLVIMLKSVGYRASLATSREICTRAREELRYSDKERYDLLRLQR